MKSIIKIHLCVLLLTIISNGVAGDKFEIILRNLVRMANDNGNIKGIFAPSKNGFLGNNQFSIIYKGLLMPQGINATMKFTTPIENCEHEYNMYTYLGAINNEAVEANGIPVIYGHGTWNNCGMIAMTLFDPEFLQSFDDNKLNEIDLLILLHEFVRITKYTHSCGVFHIAIHLRHMTFRKQQGFIYDFVSAITFPGNIAQQLYAARADWHQLLSAMHKYIQVKSSRWSWLGFSGPMDLPSFLSTLTHDAESNEPHKFGGLRRVFVELCKYAMGDDSTSGTQPFYNQPYQAIIEEIDRYAHQQRSPVIPSWFSDNQNEVQPSSSWASHKRNRGETSFSPSKRFKG